jgi:hypothetical protein
VAEGGQSPAFVSLSVVLTGFGEVELAATGSTSTYERWLAATFPVLFRELLETWQAIERAHPDPARREAALRRDVLADQRLGPLALNLTLLWYTANWVALPASWASTYHQPDVPSRVFGLAYPESLVWKAAGTHPVGANPTGFGGWALPPVPLSEIGSA